MLPCISSIFLHFTRRSFSRASKPFSGTWSSACSPVQPCRNSHGRAVCDMQGVCTREPDKERGREFAKRDERRESPWPLLHYTAFLRDAAIQDSLSFYFSATAPHRSVCLHGLHAAKPNSQALRCAGQPARRARRRAWAIRAWDAMAWRSVGGIRARLEHLHCAAWSR